MPEGTLTVGCQQQGTDRSSTGDIQDTGLLRATCVLIWMMLCTRLTEKERIRGEAQTATEATVHE